MHLWRGARGKFDGVRLLATVINMGNRKYLGNTMSKAKSAKRARRIAKYNQWKSSGISDGYQHFEVWGIFPLRGNQRRRTLKRVSRQLADSASSALTQSRVGLRDLLKKDVELFVIERFDPDKQRIISSMR